MNIAKKVSHILILIFILTIFLSGCGVFSLSNFVLPDDIDFIKTIEINDTPQKICCYVKENFTYKENLFYNPSPYELWLNPEGDCNDFVTYALFGANYHNYPTWQMFIYFKGTFIKHILGIFLEDGKYTYLNIKAYCPICASSFKDVVSHYFINHELELNYYKVFDYNMNLIETGD